MKSCLSFSILILSLTLSGCSTVPRDTITQTSTIDALLAGQYDGILPCSELLKHGNFGIGTFDRLDGEMIILDGTVYQVRSDGRVYTPARSLLSPFAAVCNFKPDTSLAITNTLTFQDVEAWLNREQPNTNSFCAIRIDGTFAKVRTRSVPAQSKPYPPLAEVSKTQPEFQMQDIEGTIIGFRCPPFVKGINVPGYHLHFLSRDRTRGGHVLAMELTRGTCTVDRCHQFLLILPPDDTTLQGLDLSRDRSHELQQVEK